jgi:hypothetical protein
MEEDKKITTIGENQKESTNQPQPKFIAVINTDDGGIAFNLNGVEVEEAYLLLIKGRIKFEKIYEQYIREHIGG